MAKIPQSFRRYTVCQLADRSDVLDRIRKAQDDINQGKILTLRETAKVLRLTRSGTSYRESLVSIRKGAKTEQPLANR